jgi:hypothetical protein
VKKLSIYVKVSTRIVSGSSRWASCYFGKYPQSCRALRRIASLDRSSISCTLRDDLSRRGVDAARMVSQGSGRARNPASFSISLLSLRDFISLREGVVRSWGCVAAIDSHGRTIWIADAHRGDGQRFVARFILDNIFSTTAHHRDYQRPWASGNLRCPPRLNKELSSRSSNRCLGLV